MPSKKTTVPGTVITAPQGPMLPVNGTVKAVVIGIENYQGRLAGALNKVDYAHQDAEGFIEVLRVLYGDSLDAELIVDNDATHSNIKYRLRNFIGSLEADDLFVFYYAGHGFHGHGGNRITAWDTNADHIEETTLLLREVLLDPLQHSACRRSLAFVDACAANFRTLLNSRDVVTDFNKHELKTYLTSTQYFAMYLSCSPGEKSYPSNLLKHGIWTHFLLKALRGEAEEALGPDRYLTDQGLKDYLHTSVRQYMTKETSHRGVQTPQATITANGSFAIRDFPLPAVPAKEVGDLRDVRVTPIREFFEGVEEESLHKLPGFNKRIHFVPERPNMDATTFFIRQLLNEKIQEEVQDLYDAIKEEFKLRAKNIVSESDDGVGSIDTDYFRYTLEPRHHIRDASKYQIVHKLEIRAAADAARIDQIDRVFSGKLQKLVVKTSRDFIDFSKLVDRLEELAESSGGRVTDEQAKERVTYEAPDGAMIVFSVRIGRIAISAKGARSVQPLLHTARNYRFGLEGPSTVLLA